MFGLKFGTSLWIIRSRVTNNRENETVMTKRLFKIIVIRRRKCGRCLNQDNSKNYPWFEFVISTCIKQYCYRTRLCEAEYSRAGDVRRIERNKLHTFWRKCTSHWMLLEFASIFRKTRTQRLEWMDYGDGTNLIELSSPKICIS